MAYAQLSPKTVATAITAALQSGRLSTDNVAALTAVRALAICSEAKYGGADKVTVTADEAVLFFEFLPEVP